MLLKQFKVIFKLIFYNINKILYKFKLEKSFMGKTGSVTWTRIKGRKGNAKKIENGLTFKAHPGPAQRFTSKGSKRRYIKRSQNSISK